jgi:hypothetical protein
MGRGLVLLGKSGSRQRRCRVIRNVWEGCRQESVKDGSCYTFIIDDEQRRSSDWGWRGIVAGLAGYTPCSGDRHGPPIVLFSQLAAH